MSEFSGKVAIVTGSSSGIGEAIARTLHALGASVVINSSSSVEAGQQIATSLGDNAIYVQADISDKASGQRLIDETLKQFGQLDILINNAGWTKLIAHHDLEALTDEIFTRTFDVNVTGTWMLTKAAMPHLKKSDDGNVVNITSVAGVRPIGSSMAYSMTKAALNQMTVLLAKSCGPVCQCSCTRSCRNTVDKRLAKSTRISEGSCPTSPLGHHGRLRASNTWLATHEICNRSNLCG